MPTYGLTATGFVRKPYEVILAEIEASQRSGTTAGASLNVSPDSLVGQLNAPIAAKLAELWEVAQAVTAAMDPDAAEDAAQDALYSLTNSLRRPARYSRVLATVDLAAGTTLEAGEHIASVAGSPQARFTPEADFTAPADGDYEVWFVALEPGPVVANAATLTVRDVSPSSGWEGVTNAEDADVGEPIEGNASYRLRRALELASQGGGTIDGIRADLSQLDEVDSVAMLENVTPLDDGNGLPPHSFDGVVRSGDNADIGGSIWGNKPAGIRAFGDVLVTVQDSEGRDQVVAFSRPDEIEAYASVTVVVDDAEYAGDVALRAALTAATLDPEDVAYLDSGEALYAARLVCVALEVEGVIDVHVGLSTASVPSSGSGASMIAAGPRSLIALDTSRIGVYGGDGGGDG